MKFFIETQRLVLREILETDIKGMFALDSNAEVHKYLGNNPIKTKTQAKENITYIREQYEKFGIGRFAIINKENNEFMGWSGLKFNTGEKESINGYSNFIDIGYRLIPNFWKQGFALESAIACLKFGFEEMKYSTIYAAALEENIGSNKILQKIGLHHVNDFNYKDLTAKWYQLKKDEYGR